MRNFRVLSTVLLGATSMAVAGLSAPAVAAVAAPTIVHGVYEPAGVTSPGALFTPGPKSPTATWSSSNWSGYAETGTYTSTSGNWTIPTVTAGAANKRSQWYSSDWVGIDGFNNSDLIQAGTEQDFYSGQAHYSAWWEILPASETVINEPVSPGDSISAAIADTGTTIAVSEGRGRSVAEPAWKIVLTDSTKGWTYSVTEPYTGPGSSSEWITEAPEVNGAIATISDYSFPAASAAKGDFNGAYVESTVGGPWVAANLSDAADAGFLVQNGVQVSTPGQQDPYGVAYNSAYGATAPAAPTS